MAEMERDYKKLEAEHFEHKAQTCPCRIEGPCKMLNDVCQMKNCPFVHWGK